MYQVFSAKTGEYYKFDGLLKALQSAKRNSKSNPHHAYTVVRKTSKTISPIADIDQIVYHNGKAYTPRQWYYFSPR